MSDDKPRHALDELGAKLRAARKRGEAGQRGETRGSALGFAMRVGVELVAALAVGVGIGLLLDRWLGTAPWLLLLFFVLGSAAGILNVFRLVQGYGHTAGYRKPDRRESPPADD